MSERFTIEYIEEQAGNSCTNAHHCAMMRQLLVTITRLKKENERLKAEAKGPWVRRRPGC